MPIFIMLGVHGELAKLTEVSGKIPKTCYMGSGLFKLIEFGTSRTGIYNFLLVTNSNLGCMSHDFQVMET